MFQGRSLFQPNPCIKRVCVLCCAEVTAIGGGRCGGVGEPPFARRNRLLVECKRVTIAVSNDRVCMCKLSCLCWSKFPLCNCVKCNRRKRRGCCFCRPPPQQLFAGSARIVFAPFEGLSVGCQLAATMLSLLYFSHWLPPVNPQPFAFTLGEASWRLQLRVYAAVGNGAALNLSTTCVGAV